MSNFKKHLVLKNTPIKKALLQLNELAKDAILFIVDEKDRLIGSLTDGDIRRGLIKGITIEDAVNEVIQSNPKFIKNGETDIQKIIDYRESNFRILPIIDDKGIIINVINFRENRSYIPVDAVIMAGGRGERLRPLTNNVPKPLLPVGGKAILDHNLDRLVSFGIDSFWLTLNYLGLQIEEHEKNVGRNGIDIQYVWEDSPMGTIGAVSKIKNFKHDYILITNSDLLTNLDYEDFFMEFLKQNVEMAVVSIPYEVNIPYAVLETENGDVKSFKEKPTYTYYSNAGIYMVKRSALDFLPKENYFNATDLMERLISSGKRIFSYPFNDYWLDIGSHTDYEKSQRDIKHIKF